MTTQNLRYKKKKKKEMQAQTTKIILVPWQQFCKIDVHFPLITVEKQEIIIYY